jgi:DNA-binding NtrC family response regulator
LNKGKPIMSRCRVVVIADDPILARAISGQLHDSLGQAARIGSFPSNSDPLSLESADSLLLATTAAANAQQAVRLVQEVTLQQGPPMIVVVAGEAAAHAEQLAGLASYIGCRLRWPEDAALLTSLVGDHLAQGWKVTDSEEESLEEIIRRRLLRWTPSLLPMVERLALAASHNVNVLLTGETGTGKPHLARLIHECSPRQGQRFLVVPCGALAAHLVDSEFFGHVKGAFTGADQPKVGKFAAAGTGTLLLDEIDALGLPQQAKLLRVLETGEYEPVGSNQTELCTARIIAASNWNLEEAVQNGKFRADLYHRLDVMSFQLPPLRERVEDIAPLVRGMTARFNRKFRKNLFAISPSALAALEAFPWPGNLRQLENAVQQAVLVSTGPELLVEHLPLLVQKRATRTAGTGQASGPSLHADCETAERLTIQRALRRCGQSRVQAARLLGISCATLFRKLKKHRLMGAPSRTAVAAQA